MLDFFDHVDWSGKKIDKNMKKVIEYFKKNNILYGEDPFDFRGILIEMTKAEFLEFATFLKEELGASLNCLHIPYQTFCVNGEGNFEVIDELPAGMTIDDFVYYMWQKRVEFPKIDLPKMNENNDRD